MKDHKRSIVRLVVRKLRCWKIAIMNFFYNCKWFVRNLKWMLPQVWKFRPWDSYHNIELFAASLEETSKCLRNGHLMNGEKYGRRCLYIAKLLKKYYCTDEFSIISKDKSYQQLAANNPSNIKEILWNNNSYCSTLTRDYKISEEYHTKMFKLIHKRVKEVDQKNKKELWKYINKYLPYFWD